MEFITSVFTTFSTNIALAVVKSVLKTLTAYPINVFILSLAGLIIIVQFLRNLLHKNEKGNEVKLDAKIKSEKVR